MMKAFIAFLDALIFSTRFPFSVKAYFRIQFYYRFWYRVTLKTEFQVNLVWNVLQSFFNFLAEFSNCLSCSYYVHRNPLPLLMRPCVSTLRAFIPFLSPSSNRFIVLSAGLCAVSHSANIALKPHSATSMSCHEAALFLRPSFLIHIIIIATFEYLRVTIS